MLLAVLENKPGPARDIVLLNAGATLYVAGLVDSMVAGIAEARRVLERGAAAEKLHALVVFSQQPAA